MLKYLKNSTFFPGWKIYPRLVLFSVCAIICLSEVPVGSAEAKSVDSLKSEIHGEYRPALHIDVGTLLIHDDYFSDYYNTNYALLAGVGLETGFGGSVSAVFHFMALNLRQTIQIQVIQNDLPISYDRELEWRQFIGSAGFRIDFPVEIVRLFMGAGADIVLVTETAEYHAYSSDEAAHLRGDLAKNGTGIYVESGIEIPISSYLNVHIETQYHVASITDDYYNQVDLGGLLLTTGLSFKFLR